MPGFIDTNEELRRLLLGQTASPVVPDLDAEQPVVEPGSLPAMPAPGSSSQSSVSVSGPTMKVPEVTPAPDFALRSPPAVESLTAPKLQVPDMTPGPAVDYAKMPAPYVPEAKDYSGAMHAAREVGDRTRFLGGLAGAMSDFSSALGGQKPQYGARDYLNHLADAPEARVRDDMALDEVSARARAANEAANPASATNQRFRAQLAQTAPWFARAMGPAFESMTSAQLEKALGIRKDTMTLANDAATKDFQNQNTAATFNRQAGQDSFKNDLDLAKFSNDVHKDQESLITGRINASAASARFGQGGLTPAQKMVTDRFNQTRQDQLGKDMTKHSDVYQALLATEKLLPGITDGKLPEAYAKQPTGARIGDRLAMKLGPTTGGLTTNFASPQGQRIDQALQNFTDLIGRARSGAVINANELAKFEQMIGSGALSDPQMLANAYRDFKGALYRSIRERQEPLANPTDPQFEVLSSYKGVTYRDPFFNTVRDPNDGTAPAAAPATPPAPAPASAAQQASPTPAPTPAAPRPSRPASPGKAWVVYPNDPTKTPYEIPANLVGKDGSVGI